MELLVTRPTLLGPIDPNTNRKTYCWEFVNDSYNKFKFHVEEKYQIQMLITKQKDYMFLMYIMSRNLEEITNRDGISVVEVDGILSS